jgi:lipocalin
LLHEYGKLVSKKLAINVFGAFVILAGSTAQLSSAQATSTSPLTAVDKVDLRRYAGKWYGIARYPNRFRVTVNPTRLLSTGYEVTEKSKWSMRAVRRMGR